MTEETGEPDDPDTKDDSEPVGFLSGEDLKHLVNKDYAVHYLDGAGDAAERISLGLGQEEDWSDWTVDLSLGEEVYISSDEEVRFLKEHESVSIGPGEFALLMTEEVVKIPPNRAAFISLKFQHAVKGLINISGFHVDPNFHGKLVFSVYNAGPSPAILRRGDPVFMIVFASLSSPVQGNREGAHFKDIERLKPDWLSGLQGRTASLEALDADVRTLQTRVNLLITVGVGVLIAILTGWFTGGFT